MSFSAEIRKRAATQITPTNLLTSLPEASPEGVKYEPGARAALLKKYPDTDPRDIIRILWPREGWRISRNEFTTLITGRYCFALVLTPSDREDEYWAAGVNFMQSARFMGFSFGETFVQSLLSVDRIPKKIVPPR